MKARALMRYLYARGCPIKQESPSHLIYWNPQTGRREPVPNVPEIPYLLSRKICRTLDIPEP